MSQSTTATTNAATTSQHRSMISRLSNIGDEVSSVMLNRSSWEKRSQHDKLEIAMKYLDKVDNTKKAAFFLEESQMIMQHLHQEFQADEQYLPWVRYFDICARKKEEYPGKKEGSEGYLFKKGMESLVINVLLSQNQIVKGMDWRIVKRILSIPSIFPDEYDPKNSLLASIPKDDIMRAVQIEIGKALDYMVWIHPNSLTITAKQALETLDKCFRDNSFHDLLNEAIIAGRFDKNKFGISNSLILGEDGGLFLLLNRLTKKHQEDMVITNIVTDVYLKDKIIYPTTEEEPKKAEKFGDKVVLGKGGFGSVKFALSLFKSKVSPGDIICIKKTQNFQTLAPKHGEMIPSPLKQATEATIGDYFASGIADKVYAPHIFDLAIVTDQNLASNTRDNKADHRKGYLMMEMFPQNTATRIFKDPKYQKYQQWKYQKPYILEVMLGTLELLSHDIAFTDLKPDNTLFDVDTFKTTIIDLGGTIKIDPTAGDDAGKFDKSKYTFQTTEAYRAPELGDSDSSIINLPKALTYTCGKVMAEVVQNSDYNKEELQDLISKLTDSTADKRTTIEEAIKALDQMGDNSYKEDVILNQYISKIKDRIEHNPSSISLNEDILKTKELYINLNIATQDPKKYKNLPTEDLFQRMDSFLATENKQHQVMAIFGSAGSGKSIALQIKFIEAIENWKS